MKRTRSFHQTTLSTILQRIQCIEHEDKNTAHSKLPLFLFIQRTQPIVCTGEPIHPPLGQLTDRVSPVCVSICRNRNRERGLTERT